jgi:hypothetical protein
MGLRLLLSGRLDVLDTSVVFSRHSLPFAFGFGTSFALQRDGQFLTSWTT